MSPTFLRGIWGLVNLSRRPPHKRSIERLAALGHVLMYLLLIAIPTIALVREYGSEDSFSVLGVQLFAGRKTEVEWMTSPGSQWHGFLGWVLIALIAGHIAMAFVHIYVWEEPLISRMTKARPLPVMRPA